MLHDIFLIFGKIILQYIFFKRLSVRGLHSVAHNKTQAGNVDSGGSQKIRFTNSSTNMANYQSFRIFIRDRTFQLI